MHADNDDSSFIPRSEREQPHEPAISVSLLFTEEEVKRVDWDRVFEEW